MQRKNKQQQQQNTKEYHLATKIYYTEYQYIIDVLHFK